MQIVELICDECKSENVDQECLNPFVQKLEIKDFRDSETIINKTSISQSDYTRAYKWKIFCKDCGNSVEVEKNFHRQIIPKKSNILVLNPIVIPTKQG